MIREINNERAHETYEDVKKIKDIGGGLQKEFRTLARSFPFMVQRNGLGTAVAFLYAKKKGKRDSAHEKLYESLQNWLKHEDLIQINNQGELIDAVVSCNSDEYRMITREVMAYMQWMKRFSEGMLSADDDKAR